MINYSNPSIVTWNEAGDRFIVKDQVRLSAECIPLYFSHSNFSSFTRQLNFYRFRKIFPSVKLGSGQDIVPLNEKHLIFYHEKFHRDHPEWLPDIKRSTKSSRSSAEQEQIIEDLQLQVVTLEHRLEVLTNELHSKISTISDEYDKKISALERRIDEQNITDRGMPLRNSSEHHVQATLPSRQNRYSTEDLMRSILHMDGNNRGGDSLSAAASTPLNIPQVIRPMNNRVGMLSLEDINRLVHGYDGILHEASAAPWPPAPPNPLSRITSLSAEDILVALRSIENSKISSSDREIKDSTRY